MVVSDPYRGFVQNTRAYTSLPPIGPEQFSTIFGPGPSSICMLATLDQHGKCARARIS